MQQKLPWMCCVFRSQQLNCFGIYSILRRANKICSYVLFDSKCRHSLESRSSKCHLEQNVRWKKNQRNDKEESFKVKRHGATRKVERIAKRKTKNSCKSIARQVLHPTCILFNSRWVKIYEILGLGRLVVVCVAVCLSHALWAQIYYVRVIKQLA